MADLLFRVKGFRIKDCVIEDSQVGKKTAVILMTLESTPHSKGWATDIYPPPRRRGGIIHVMSYLKEGNFDRL